MAFDASPARATVPRPPADSVRLFRGLSPEDIYVLFAHHGGAEEKPGFYRRQLWLNRLIEGMGKPEIALWWSRLSEATRRYAGRGRMARKLPPDEGWNSSTRKRLHKELAKAKAERARGWVSPPDSRSHLEHHWLSYLLLSWWGTVCHTTGELVERLRGLPEDAKRILLGEECYRELASCLSGTSEIIPCRPRNGRGGQTSVDRWVRTRLQGARVNHARVSGQTLPRSLGSTRKRRHKWLERYEAGWSFGAIRDWWNGLTEAERLKWGGKSGCRTLPDRPGYKGTALSVISREVALARWEREQEGKPPSFGRGLWALIKQREGLSNPEIGPAWARLTIRTRKRYCPVVYEEFRSTSEVYSAIANAKRHGAEEAADRLARLRRPFEGKAKQTNPLGVILWRWHGEEGLSERQCFERWIGLSQQEQEALAPGCAKKIPGGSRGYKMVRHRLRYMALKAGKAEPNRDRPRWERDHLFLEWDREGLKGSSKKRERFEGLPPEEQERLWPGYAEKRRRGRLSSLNATIASFVYTAEQEEASENGAPEQEADRSVGQSLDPPKARKPPAGKRGPKGPRSDAKADRRLWEAWHTGMWGTKRDLAIARGLREKDVVDALERERKRRSRKSSK